MKITLQVDNVAVNPGSHRQVEVEIDGFSVSDLVSEVGIPDLLDAIGKDECASHFNLVEEE
jgi:hypothetical protein